MVFSSDVILEHTVTAKSCRIPPVFNSVSHIISDKTRSLEKTIHFSTWRFYTSVFPVCLTTHIWSCQLRWVGRGSGEFCPSVRKLQYNVSLTCAFLPPCGREREPISLLGWQCKSEWVIFQSTSIFGMYTVNCTEEMRQLSLPFSVLKMSRSRVLTLHSSSKLFLLKAEAVWGWGVPLMTVVDGRVNSACAADPTQRTETGDSSQRAGEKARFVGSCQCIKYKVELKNQEASDGSTHL